MQLKSYNELKNNHAFIAEANRYADFHKRDVYDPPAAFWLAIDNETTHPATIEIRRSFSATGNPITMEIDEAFYDK